MELARFKFGIAQSVVKGWSDFLKSFSLLLGDRRVLFSQVKEGNFNFLIRVVEAENYLRRRKNLLGKQFFKPKRQP